MTLKQRNNSFIDSGFCPTKLYQRVAPLCNMINICSIMPILSREQWDKIDSDLGTNFMLHRVFFAALQKKNLHGPQCFFYARMQWNMLHSMRTKNNCSGPLALDLVIGRNICGKTFTTFIESRLKHLKLEMD